MNNIERLFDGDRAVPGMRSGGSRTSVNPSSAVETSAEFSERQLLEAKRAAAEAAIDAEPIDRASVLDVEPEIEEAVPFALYTDREVMDPGRLKPGPELLYAREPGGARGERVRLLRTHLLLQNAADSDTNTIALLSPGAGEGRSLLAAEIALSFAQFNRPTLLVDVDFRRPRQHKLFGGSLDYGLAQAIANQRPPAYHSVEGYENLTVVTAGTRPENPLELLMDWRFESLFESWRRNFEFIVLDTPPVNEFADALAVATVAARVLLVYRAQHTFQKEAREMLRRLAGTNAEIVGGVLNHF